MPTVKKKLMNDGIGRLSTRIEQEPDVSDPLLPCRGLVR